MALDDFFLQHPVFHHEELVAYLKQQGHYNANSLKNLLHYHINKKHIIRIRRGYYALGAKTGYAGAIADDGMLVAGRMTHDAVITYHTALTFHALAYSLSDRVYFCSHVDIRPFKFMSRQYRRISHPTPLQPDNIFIETKMVDRQGMDIRVTTIERTFVDCLDKPHFAHGWEEIWQAAGMLNFLDGARMIDYALQLDNATTIAKVGFFLEQHQAQFSITEPLLKRLEQHKPKSKHYMSHSPEPMAYSKRWHLLVPKSIINQDWQEPNHDII